MKKMVGGIALVALNLFVVGCNNQLSREELKAMQDDCKSNIFHELSFTFGNTDQRNPLIVQHIKDGKTIEEFTVLFEDQYATKRTIYGDDTYRLKIDGDVYVLTELKGRYNPRCHMFGCDPACGVDTYKIDNQKKHGMDISLTRDGVDKLYSPINGNPVQPKP